MDQNGSNRGIIRFASRYRSHATPHARFGPTQQAHGFVPMVALLSVVGAQCDTSPSDRTPIEGPARHGAGVPAHGGGITFCGDGAHQSVQQTAAADGEQGSWVSMCLMAVLDGELACLTTCWALTLLPTQALGKCTQAIPLPLVRAGTRRRAAAHGGCSCHADVPGQACQ